jgi:hypothetical protein
MVSRPSEALTANMRVPPTWRSSSRLVAREVVLVTLDLMPVNATATLFQVSVMSIEGASAVRVPRVMMSLHAFNRESETADSSILEVPTVLPMDGTPNVIFAPCAILVKASSAVVRMLVMDAWVAPSQPKDSIDDMESPDAMAAVAEPVVPRLEMLKVSGVVSASWRCICTVPVLLTKNLDTESDCRSISWEVAAEVVLVTLNFQPVNATATLFQVSVQSIEGASAARVPRVMMSRHEFNRESETGPNSILTSLVMPPVAVRRNSNLEP